MKCLIFLLWISLSLPLLAHAQDEENDTTIRDPVLTGAQIAGLPMNTKLTGTVSSHEHPNHLHVSISKVGATAVLAMQELNAQNGFEFRGLDPGDYKISVTDSNFCLRYTATVRL